MGPIRSAFDESGHADENLGRAAFQADNLAHLASTQVAWLGRKIDELAIFVACDGRAGYCSALDLRSDTEIVERFIADRHMSRPSIPGRVRRDPEKWICIGVGAVLREQARSTPHLPDDDRRSESLKIIADALVGTTKESRATYWAEARRVSANGYVPSLAFLVSEPSVRLAWFKLRPAPYFQTICPLDSA